MYTRCVIYVKHCIHFFSLYLRTVITDAVPHSGRINSEAMLLASAIVLAVILNDVRLVLGE